MTQSPDNDTSPEALRVQTEIYRGMTLGRKWELICRMHAGGRMLHETGFRMRKPDATAEDVFEDWLRVTLGPELAAKVMERRREYLGRAV